MSVFYWMSYLPFSFLRCSCTILWGPLFSLSRSFSLLSFSCSTIPMKIKSHKTKLQMLTLSYMIHSHASIQTNSYLQKRYTQLFGMHLQSWTIFKWKIKTTPLPIMMMKKWGNCGGGRGWIFFYSIQDCSSAVNHYPVLFKFAWNIFMHTVFPQINAHLCTSTPFWTKYLE